MNAIGNRVVWAAAGAAWAVLAGLPALADDTEIFFVDPDDVQAGPNILLVLDNSGSMLDMVETQAPYDPSVIYDDQGCAGRVYWATGSDPEVPSCSSDNWFDQTRFACNAAVQQFGAGAQQYRDRMAQYNSSGSGSNPLTWLALSPEHRDRFVECEDDAGVHGESSGSGDVYTRNGSGTANGWSTSSNVSWPSTQITVFDGNYLNWYHGPVAELPKIDIVKAVAANLLNVIDDANVGLVLFNVEEGGYVAHALEDVATARPLMQQKINDLIIGLPYSQFTPLSETLYEAAQYFRGGAIEYGDVGVLTSVPESRSGDTYVSALQEGCQKNFIVLLSDGEPTRDGGADDDMESLPGWSAAVGNDCDDNCLDDLAEYLHEEDLSPLDGDQTVVTYTIGFDIDLPLLESTAERGGGAYYTANDSASLSSALTSILYDIFSQSSTFSAPAVSVNSFNRLQNLNDLFVSVFTATGNSHWPGNLKKYRLRPSDAAIVDAAGDPAVNAATGFFADGARSFWSPTPDGPNVTAGGAANRIPAPADRNVYTYLSGGNLTAAENQVAIGNLLIDDTLLNIGADGPSRNEIIEFIRGTQPGGTQARQQMGDPLHAQPASITYDANRTLIYFATNDGYLHAIDTDSGIEEWAFVPTEFLQDQIDLYLNEPIDTRRYGIDGNLRLQVIADTDGVIEPGEKVYLFFGMRRGGDFYYGLDVTNPDSPRVMWRLPGSGAQALPGIGQTWSTPVPTRIDIDGTTRPVIVFGGGYDLRHDADTVSGADTVGNGIFIVDSETGDVLWRGAKNGTTPSFANMDYAIPADIKVVDLTADGLADRMYAADMGGQVWRFDIHNGQTASGLITGGVIAQLGAAPAASPPAESTRRFYYSPDVALVNAHPPFVHIGIGSGHRARPNSTLNQDRFYALRDYAPFTKLTQTDYNTRTPIGEGDLIDVTDNPNAAVPAGADGWRVELREAGDWRGEKVIAEARTFNNQVFFTTFTPATDAGGDSSSCSPSIGTSRLYIMDVYNGAPVNNLDGSVDAAGNEDVTFTVRDRYRQFPGSIASAVVFIFPSAEDPDCVGEECTPPPVACVDLFCFPPGFGNDPVRTFWRQENVD